MDSTIEVVSLVLVGCVVLVLAVTVFTVALGAGQANIPPRRPERLVRRVPIPQGAFPVVTHDDATPIHAFPVTLLSAAKIRRYRIVGVDPETRADLDFEIDAATPANAKVKAELAGIIVTEVAEAVELPDASSVDGNEIEPR